MFVDERGQRRRREEAEGGWAVLSFSAADTLSENYDSHARETGERPNGFSHVALASLPAESATGARDEATSDHAQQPDSESCAEAGEGAGGGGGGA